MALSFLLLSKAMIGSVLAAYRYTFASSWKSTLKRLVTRGTEGHLLRCGPRLRVAKALNISMIMNFGQISWHLWSKMYGLYYNLHTWLIERKNILTQNQQQLTHSKTLKLVPRLKVYPEGLYLHGSDLTALMNMMVSGYQNEVNDANWKQIDNTYQICFFKNLNIFSLIYRSLKNWRKLMEDGSLKSWLVFYLLESLLRTFRRLWLLAWGVGWLLQNFDIGPTEPFKLRLYFLEKKWSWVLINNRCSFSNLPSIFYWVES